MVQAGCKLTPTRRALLAEGLCSKPSPEALGVDAEALGVGQPGSRGWFINGWVWNGLRQPVLWMTAGIVVGAQPRFRLRVSTRLLFVRLEKLLFFKGIFFQCSVFFCMPSSVHPFLVYGICLRNCTYYFFSLRVSSPCRSVASFLRVRGSTRTCALDARVSARVVRAKPSERSACV